MAKFVLPPLEKVMRDRDSTIRSSLQAGDEGHVEANRLATARRETLERAHQEARSIIEAATREAESLREAARGEAQAQFESDLAAAGVEIDQERRQLREETLARLDVIVVEAAERVIGVNVDVDKHRDAIAAAIASASGDATSETNQ
jgi:F-type H+-transporting ATPase subunit b